LSEGEAAGVVRIAVSLESGDKDWILLNVALDKKKPRRRPEG
jgi:hypothetical protein